MSENFKKIKRGYFRKAAVFGTAAGLSFALLSVGIVLLVLKRNAIQINAAYYVLIAFGSALAAGIPVFFFLRPTDKKIARKTDADYSLNEKIQTMVQFRGEESDIVKLQREDAEKVLSKLPARKPKWNKILQYCVVPVAAVALFLTAVCIPAKEPLPAGGMDNDKYAASEFDLAALNQLIDEVKKSSLEDSVKQSVAGSLEKLLREVSQTDSKAAMLTSVTGAVSEVDTAIGSVNSYFAICVELQKRETCKPYSAAIVDALSAYWSGGLDIDTYGKVEQIESRLNDSVNTRFGNATAPLREAFAVTQVQGLKEILGKFLQEFRDALNASEIRSDDALFLALNHFAETLGALSDNLSGQYKDEFVQQRLDGAFETLKREAVAAITVQSYQRMMNVFVRTRLSEIFEIPLGELPAMRDEALLRGSQGGTNGGGSEEGDKDDDKTGNGGYGSGGDLYGSNDVIFDPAVNDFVTYGEVFEEYYAKMKDGLNDSEIPEDLQKAIKAYFDILLGKNSPKDEEG